MNINHPLLEYSNNLDSGPLQLNAKGYCSFETETGTTVQLQSKEKDARVYMYVEVQAYPKKGKNNTHAQ